MHSFEKNSIIKERVIKLKKSFFIIIAGFILVMIALTIILINIQSTNKTLQQINTEYEYYLNRKIFGTDLVTLMNRAMDNNQKREVPKDENGFYMDNKEDSILITIQMLNSEEVYQMEKIFALGIDQFVELFNDSKFQSKEVTYHKQTGRIAKILFIQVE